MRTAEWEIAGKLLASAREHLANVGWQASPTGIDVRSCMAMAVETAFRRSDATISGFDYARAALLKEIGSHGSESRNGNPDAIPYWGADLVKWNDAPNRTAEEVIAAFERAEAYCRSRSAK